MATAALSHAARTRRLLEGPVAPTLLRLAAPNVVVLVVQVAINTLEAFFVGWLGSEAIAGVSVAFPVIMLMQTMSAGGMGGGVASAVARALGAGRRDDADALVLHALLIGFALGGAFTAGVLAGGPPLYRAMGAEGGTLAAALAYSNVIFAGAVIVWLFNTLASVVRGTGNMLLPAAAGLVGAFGTPALAGYGMGVRLEYMMIPLVFGLGAALVTMVGTNYGAGERARAKRVAWVGAATAAGITETIGLLAALFPRVWIGLFSSEPDVIAAGSAYLRIVGPSYGFFGLGLALYFASQGAGRLLWPILAGLARLVVATAGGFAALHWFGGGLTSLFAVMALALTLFGITIAIAVAGGAWRVRRN